MIDRCNVSVIVFGAAVTYNICIHLDRCNVSVIVVGGAAESLHTTIDQVCM